MTIVSLSSLVGLKPDVSSVLGAGTGQEKVGFCLFRAGSVPLRLPHCPPTCRMGGRLGPLSFPTSGEPSCAQGQAAHPLQVAVGLPLPPRASCPSSIRSLC